MNFKLTLTASSTPVNLTINLLDSYSVTVNKTTVFEFSTDLELAQKYNLEIVRNEPGLYLTGQLVHSSFVTVDEILIDDFWVVGDKNHWSKTYYDQKYIDYLKDKPITWELSKDLYNNVLYFNGKLSYSISTPIREMFFK